MEEVTSKTFSIPTFLSSSWSDWLVTGIGFTMGINLSFAFLTLLVSSTLGRRQEEWEPQVSLLEDPLQLLTLEPDSLAANELLQIEELYISPLCDQPEPHQVECIQHTLYFISKHISLIDKCIVLQSIRVYSQQITQCLEN